MTFGNVLWEFILFGKEFTYLQMLNPPMWSLGVELEFYALAPFLVRRKVLRRIVGVASIAYWIAIFLSTKSFDPYIYRFMFSSYILFWIGIEIYTYRDRFINCIQKINQRTQNIFLGTIIGLEFLHIFLGNIIFQNEYVATIIFIALNIVLLFLLSIKKQSLKDTFLGNLSFGVFVIHFLVMRVLTMTHLSVFKPGLILFFVTALISSILAYIAYKYLEVPLQKYKD